MKHKIYSLAYCSFAWSLALAGGCILSFAAQGADASSRPSSANTSTSFLTLDGSIRLALENNPEFRASVERVAAATGRAYQAKLWSNPELSVNAEDWPVSDGRGFSDAKQTVGMAQTIPFPGKKTLDSKIGAAGVRAMEAELNFRRLELVRDVKIAFFQVLSAERLVEVAGELVNVAESSAATASKRVAAGAAAYQEQLRSEILLEQAKTELADFQRELVTVRQTLTLLLGQPNLKEAPLSGALPETANLTLLDQDPEQWVGTHPSMLAIKIARERADLDLRRARLEPFPDIRAEVSGGRVGETDQSIIQLGFSMPLPIIDYSKGKKQEARANVAIAAADSVAVEQRLLRAWSTLDKRFRTAAEQMANYRERILPKSDEALRLVQAGFDQGKFGLIDLLDTQRTTAEVRRTYQQKLLEMNVVQAELEALLGGESGNPKP